MTDNKKPRRPAPLLWTRSLYVICAIFLEGGCFCRPLPLEILCICEGNITLRIKVEKLPGKVED